MILNDIAYCSIYLKRPKSLPSGSHLSNSHAPAYEYGICSPSQRIYACHFGEYLPISCISPPIYAADFKYEGAKTVARAATSSPCVFNDYVSKEFSFVCAMYSINKSFLRFYTKSQAKRPGSLLFC